MSLLGSVELILLLGGWLETVPASNNLSIACVCTPSVALEGLVGVGREGVVHAPGAPLLLPPIILACS